MGTKLIHLKSKAIDLRLMGYSYGHIIKTLNLKSKGTLSAWFKNIVLSEQSKLKLANNNLLATKRGLHRFNKDRSKKIKGENEYLYNSGVALIPVDINDRDLLLIGTSLYWGEGTKAGEGKSTAKFSFANSDPEMIKVCMRFLRETLLIDERKIRGGIHIYPDTDVAKARNFWSSITGISKEKFYIITQVSRASKYLKGNRLQYGTVHIQVNNRLIFYKVKGMITGLIKQLSSQ